MALTNFEKVLLIAGVTLGAVLLGTAFGQSTEDDWEDEPDDDGDWASVPRWRHHELNVVSSMEESHPEATVLDNPSIPVGDRVIKPDVVVVDDYGVAEVREAKAVQVLTRGHVRQAVQYDVILEPALGTTIAVEEHTYVSEKVLDFAIANGIGIETA